MNNETLIENRRILANLTGKSEEEIGREFGELFTNDYVHNAMPVVSDFVRKIAELDLLNAIEKGVDQAYNESGVMHMTIMAMLLRDFDMPMRMKILEGYIRSVQKLDMLKR